MSKSNYWNKYNVHRYSDNPPRNKKGRGEAIYDPIYTQLKDWLSI